MGDEIRYLPQDIASALRMTFRTQSDRSELRWRIERLLERAYSDGYHAGVVRGTLERCDDEADERRELRNRIAGLEGERDAADDSLTSIREQLGVADEPGWMNEVQVRLTVLLARDAEVSR